MFDSVHSVILYKVKKAAKNHQSRYPLTIGGLSEVLGFTEEEILISLELGESPAIVTAAE